MSWRHVPLLALLVPACGFAAAAPPSDQAVDCTLRIQTTLPLQMTDSALYTVPVTLDKQPFRMLVDTGDFFSVITERTAKLLGKDPIPAGNFGLVGWGGSKITDYVDLDEFSFGRMKRGKTQFMVMKQPELEFDGLLGADFLYYYDLDFDFAKAKLNLINPDHCPGKVIYWTKGDYGVVPFDFKNREIRLNVVLDGQEIGAIVDTGATTTVMSLEFAQYLFNSKAGVKIDAKSRFKSLSFGSVSVTNPAVELVADNESYFFRGVEVKMIIGADVLRRLHLLLSYKEQKIYVTPAMQY